MALFPWRFQADVPKDEIDPMVTLFVGPKRQKLDDLGEPNGESFIQQDTSNPVQVPLSELAGVLADPSVLTELRKKK